MDHYKETLATSRSAIRETAMPDAIFKRSLQVCTRWARRQLGTRMDLSVLDTALSDIRGAQRILFEGPAVTTVSRGQCTHEAEHVSVHTQTSAQDLSEFDQEVELFQPPQNIDAEEMDLTEEHAATKVTEAAEGIEPTEATPEQPGTSQEAQHSASHTQPEPGTSRLSRRCETEDRSLQRTLFGAIAVPEPPRHRSRSLPNHLRLAPKEEVVLLGDENIESFGNDWTDVLAPRNGRLNFFRTLLRSAREEFPGVYRFVLVLSPLDRQNAVRTNLIAIRNIFSVAKRRFPNARAAIACDGICDCQPEEVQLAIRALNDTLRATPPNQATIIPPPDDYRCVNGRWTTATKEAYRTRILDFLD